jgi:hypothetical protein
MARDVAGILSAEITRAKSFSFAGILFQLREYVLDASFHAQAQSCTRAATKQPDGQISKNLSSPRAKNIPLNPSGKSVI